MILDVAAECCLILFDSMEKDILLNAEETVMLLRLKDVKALYWLNYTRQGPPARRLGRELRYFRSEVLAYIASLPAAQ